LNAAPGLFFAVGGILIIIITVWKGVVITFDEGNSPSEPKKPEEYSGGGGGGDHFALKKD
jgi:hypothetical protein